jgi:hypothetical protein
MCLQLYVLADSSATTPRNAGDDQVDLDEFIALCGGEHVFAANAARFQQTTGVKRGHQLPGAVAMAAMAPSLDSPSGSRATMLDFIVTIGCCLHLCCRWRHTLALFPRGCA